MRKITTITTLLLGLFFFAFSQHNTFHVGHRVYPNPFKEKLTVETEGYLWKNGVFKLYNIIGEEVARKQFADTNQFNLEFKELEKGIYLYSISNYNGEIYSGRITAN